MNLVDLYRTFNQNTDEYTSFLATHATFSKTDNVLGFKNSFNINETLHLI